MSEHSVENDVVRKARFYENECGNEKRERGQHPNVLGWMCTRPRGHKGKHVAHDIDGSLITTWTSGGGTTASTSRPRNLDISPCDIPPGTTEEA